MMTNNSAPSESKKPLCFVVGPIGKDASLERKHSDMLLYALIRHVLMADEFGYVVKRADEDADPGMISDRVVSDIINADLVVADLTDLNANAFYELGIRHSTQKPTIHVAKAGTVLPFDNVAHRTIFVDLGDWHSLESARDRLGNSARAIKAADYKVSNPITQANASFKMRQSEDPRDRVLASIQERLDAIEGNRGRGLAQVSDYGYLFRELQDLALSEFRQGLSATSTEISINELLGRRGIKAKMKRFENEPRFEVEIDSVDGNTVVGSIMLRP
jgi:hypothetical protein